MFDAIDGDSDGLTSVQEVQVLHSTLVNAMVENSTGEWLWRAGFDLDGDGFLNATGELRPRYVLYFEYLNQTQFQGSWYQSHFALDSTLKIIGDVPASVLILHGEGDQQGPRARAFEPCPKRRCLLSLPFFILIQPIRGIEVLFY
jgi:hypothetical protein